MSVSSEGAAPQIAEPASNMMTLEMKSNLLSKWEYN